MSDTPAFASVEAEWKPIWDKWIIEPSALKDYEVIFANIDSDNDGYITGKVFIACEKVTIIGDQARLLFSSSGLSKDVLGKIW